MVKYTYQTHVENDVIKIYTEHVLNKEDIIMINGRPAQIVTKTFNLIKRGAYEVQNISLKAKWVG